MVATWAARTPLSPNHLTLLSLGLAGIAAAAFAAGRPEAGFWGLVFFYLWAVLDHADGELARLKRAASDFGGRLDDACDIVASNLVLVGIFFGLARAWPGDHRVLAGLFTAGLTLEKITGALVLEAKRRARHLALATGRADERFRAEQRRLDRLSGREPFYLLVLATAVSFVEGSVWPAAMAVILTAGCYAMAFFSFGAWLRLRR